MPHVPPQVQGLCWQHTQRGVNTKCVDYESLLILKDGLDEGRFHLASEGTTIAIGAFGGGQTAAFPVLLLGSCKSPSAQQQKDAIQMVSDVRVSQTFLERPDLLRFAQSGDLTSMEQLYHTPEVYR